MNGINTLLTSLANLPKEQVVSIIALGLVGFALYVILEMVRNTKQSGGAK